MVFVLRRVDLGRSTPLNVWDLKGMIAKANMAKRIRERGKVFRDPVHRLIRIDSGDDFLLDLIDTPEFQRLRRIRQLGVSWLTYHGAEHSRFSHSLGVYAFAKRIHQSLLQRYRSNTEFTDYLMDHRRPLLASAMLHDIGHGPFSHMLERAFKAGADHEVQTRNLIESPDGRIGAILSDAQIDPRQVSEIIGKTSAGRLITDIVSSQLDADRMDYLLRDSLFTGVEYGRYDSEWIVRNLCVGRDPSQPGPGVGLSGYRLCMDRERGLHSAEQLILARLHMTMQVYMHRVTRGYETLLLMLFGVAAKLAARDELPRETPGVLKQYLQNKGELDFDQWITFDESAMMGAFAVWERADNRALSRLARSFLYRQRHLKSRQIDESPLKFAEVLDAIKSVAERSVEWDIDEGKCVPYKGLIYEVSNTRSRQGKGNDAQAQFAESILLASGDVDGVAVPVESVSSIMQGLDLQKQIVTRIYYDQDKAAEVEDIFDQFGIPASD